MRVIGFGLLCFRMVAGIGSEAAAGELLCYRGGEDACPVCHTLRRFHLVNMHVIEGGSRLIRVLHRWEGARPRLGSCSRSPPQDTGYE